MARRRDVVRSEFISEIGRLVFCTANVPFGELVFPLTPLHDHFGGIPDLYIDTNARHLRTSARVRVRICFPDPEKMLFNGKWMLPGQETMYAVDLRRVTRVNATGYLIIGLRPPSTGLWNTRLIFFFFFL